MSVLVALVTAAACGWSLGTVLKSMDGARADRFDFGMALLACVGVVVVAASL